MEFFVLASAHFLALLSPGPDFFIIVQTALKEDIQKAIKVCLGIAIANGLYISIAVLGLEALSQIESILLLLKYLGGAYLVYIGYMFLKAKKVEIREGVVQKEEKNFFLLGFLSAFLNPKNAIFYLSLFSLIVSVDTPLHVKIFYGLWMSGIVLFWDIGVAYMVGNKRLKAKLGFYIFSIEKVAGFVLVAFGLALLLPDFKK